MKAFIRYGAIFVILLIVALGGSILLKSENIDDSEHGLQKTTLNLESFYNDKSEYDSAFQNTSDINKQKIIAGIISHHFLAKDLIAQFFSGIDSENIKNVYIIGPDHYESLSREDSDVATSKLDWNTPYGVLRTDREVIDNLENQINLNIKDVIFRNEHSIYTLIPFVKKTFPDAKVTPLVLKTSRDYQRFYNFGRLSYRDDSLLIVSSDFSHNVNEKKAYENDTNSIRSLVSSDLANIDSIESDCKQCIAFLYGFLSHRPNKFHFMDNKTSADFGSENEENLTSYISAYYIPD